MDGDSGTAGSTQAAEGFPVTVSDCSGSTTTFAKAPAKIVTSNASSLELLLRLGAGSRVSGTGWPPGRGTMPAALDAQAQKVKVLSRTVIPKEKLLGSGADLYINTFGAMKMGGGGMGDVPSEKEFAAAGIKQLQLKTTACAAKADRPVTDLAAVEEDITSLGAVTATADRARALVDGMRAKVDAVRKAVGTVPMSRRPTYFLFDFDAGTKQPTVVCNRQIAHAVITLAGARDIFADCDDDRRQVGWEDVVAKNPDWIQIAVHNHGSASANKRAFDDAHTWLRTNAATKELKAVREGHLLRIGLERSTIAGVANADTVEEIAKALYPDKVR
ncbi:ABC transporter substrate-binding protein [Streptomyces sp. NPDC058459]|uniref:ABC transporter substrate-binding protein n=1 Tax=Streptomyces sp. NPDC058459 TaxID=3346508 RepID=UPI003666CEB0